MALISSFSTLHPERMQAINDAVEQHNAICHKHAASTTGVNGLIAQADSAALLVPQQSGKGIVPVLSADAPAVPPVAEDEKFRMMVRGTGLKFKSKAVGQTMPQTVPDAMPVAGVIRVIPAADAKTVTFTGGMVDILMLHDHMRDHHIACELGENDAQKGPSITASGIYNNPLEKIKLAGGIYEEAFAAQVEKALAGLRRCLQPEAGPVQSSHVQREAKKPRPPVHGTNFLETKNHLGPPR